MRTSLVVLGVLAIPSLARATSLGPIPGEERFQGLIDQEDRRSLSTGVGFGGIGEDYFLNLTPRFDLSFGNFGLGLQVPLRLRVIDNDPQNDNDFGGVIREEDWDEPAEFLRVIRYVRYGNKRDLVYVRVGELAAKLGNGTIMNRYMNNVDLDTFRVGVQFDLNTDYGGFETVIGNVGNLFIESDDSKVLGLRTYVKPVAFADPESSLNIFQLGVSVVGDFNAPFRLERDAVTQAPVVDPDRNFKVAEERAAVVWGLDLSVELLESPLLDVIPYTDLNFINKAGWGWHLGVDVTAKLPVGFNLTVPARVEYRRFSTDYIPTYFATFYEVERFQFPVAEASAPPKNRFVRTLPEGESINGYYADIAIDFLGLAQLGAVYEDYDNSPGGNLAAFLSVPALQIIQFKAFYTRTAVEDAADIFKLDERSFLVAQGRYAVAPFVFLVGQWSRRWTVQSDGNYRSEDDWKAGFEVAFDF